MEYGLRVGEGKYIYVCDLWLCFVFDGRLGDIFSLPVNLMSVLSKLKNGKKRESVRNLFFSHWYYYTVCDV